jgi:hypothetical protein
VTGGNKVWETEEVTEEEEGHGKEGWQVSDQTVQRPLPAPSHLWYRQIDTQTDKQTEDAI